MKQRPMFPDSKGVLHVQPIDPATDKEMVGFVESQRRKSSKKR